MILISTGGFRNQTAVATSEQLLAAGIRDIELSGGLPAPDLLDGLRQLRGRANFRLHNYFPPPPEAFVFNLATPDPVLAERCMAHVRQAIQWSTELGSQVYGFHAGFLIDPAVSELGRSIGQRRLHDRQQCLELFIERVDRLADFAREQGCDLLIENNVLSELNHESFGTDPFLMSTPEEARLIMENTPDNVNLLLDVAHLKVSARSLGYDPAGFFSLCGEWIRSYHLSDNDGLADSNESISEDSWFWPHLDPAIRDATLEVYRCTPQHLAKQRDLARRHIESRRADVDAPERSIPNDAE
jgi:sugar phosphate isomerase/epimerase